MFQMKLSDPGEGLTEAEIVSWRVAVGDEVKVNDIVVEVETSKSLVELPVPVAGKIAELLASEGDMVEVGAPILLVDDGSDDEADPAEDAADEGDPAEDAADDAPGPMLVGYGPSGAATGGRRRRRTKSESSSNGPGQASEALHGLYAQETPSRRADDVKPGQAIKAESRGDPLPGPGVPPDSAALPVLVGGGSGGPTLAKPPVRKYARQLGVNLDEVTGTGPSGSITRGDVEAAAAIENIKAAQEFQRNQSASEGPSSRTGWQDEGRLMDEEPSTGFSSGNGRQTGSAGGPQFGYFGGGRSSSENHDRREPIRGVRKVTAQAMVDSVTRHVHVTEWVTVDVTETMQLLEQLKQRREFAGLRVSPLLMYARAVCLAMSTNPVINASWDEENQEIVYHGDVNLGIAAATPRGLMVPNIKAAQQLTLLELCQAVNELVQISREGKLQPADYSQGTFTITNVGVFGIDAGTPIINGNESAILAMGSIERRAWVVGEGPDERIEPRWVTTIALGFDHKLIDGEQGSSFLHDVAALLQQPALSILY